MFPEHLAVARAMGGDVTFVGDKDLPLAGQGGHDRRGVFGRSAAGGPNDFAGFGIVRDERRMEFFAGVEVELALRR